MEKPGETRVGAGRTAAIYARVPEPYEEEQTATDQQIEACRSLAAELGYTVEDATILSDTGPSTAITRPGLTRLIGLVAKDRVSAIISYTLDRISEPETRTMAALMKELRRRDIPLYVAKMPRGYHYDPATGRLTTNPDEVEAANREEWRPPGYFAIPLRFGPD